MDSATMAIVIEYLWGIGLDLRIEGVCSQSGTVRDLFQICQTRCHRIKDKAYGISCRVILAPEEQTPILHGAVGDNILNGRITHYRHKEHNELSRTRDGVKIFCESEDGQLSLIARNDLSCVLARTPFDINWLRTSMSAPVWQVTLFSPNLE